MLMAQLQEVNPIQTGLLKTIEGPGGGLQGPPYEIDEGWLLEPYSLKTFCKGTNFSLICKKSRPNLKNWPRFRDFEISVRNWPISENAHSSANFQDIEVWFFPNIFFFIVVVDYKIKIGAQLQTIFFIFFLEGGYPLRRAARGGPPKKFETFFGLKVPQLATL